MARTKSFLLLTLIAAGLAPAAVQAQGMESLSMEGGRGVLILGHQSVDGLKAMAHLQDIAVAMVRTGRKETHHFMVAFVDTATGSQIANGSIVLRIKGPLGQEREAVRLMSMEGYFGVDITLSEKGEYTFILDTRVGGVKRRQFEFEHEIR